MVSWLCCCGGCTGACSDIPTHTFTVDTANDELDITAHGYSDGDKVVLSTSGTLPTGLAELTYYYVIVVDANTIQLETSIGGGAVTISSSGSGTHEITDTTWVDIFMDESLYTKYALAGGTFNSMTVSNGDECQLQVEDPFSDATINDDFVLHNTYTLPTGSGHVIELSVVAYELERHDMLANRTSSIGVRIGTTTLRQNFFHTRVTPFFRAGGAYSNTSTSAWSQGARITLKLTENGGNYDMEMTKVISGTPTTIFNPTGVSLTLSSTEPLGFFCTDSGGFACHYIRLRG